MDKEVAFKRVDEESLLPLVDTGVGTERSVRLLSLNLLSNFQLDISV